MVVVIIMMVVVIISTELHGRVVSLTPASYSGGTELESRPGHPDAILTEIFRALPQTLL